MARTLQFKRYPKSQTDIITGANGELIIDSTNHTLTVHDGVTAGGTRLATENFVSNTSIQLVLAQAAFDRANSASSNTITTQGVDVHQNNRITFTESINVTQNTRLNTLEILASNLNNTTIYIFGVDNLQNNRINYLESINFVQNTSIFAAAATAQNGYNQANTATNNVVYLQNVDNIQNNNIIAVNQFAQGAYNKANTFNTPTGPYADDLAAASGGVSVNALYYSADGLVHIRLV